VATKSGTSTVYLDHDASGLYDRGTGWIKYGQRWYNPTTARFTQQDSIERLADPKQGNRYAYAADNPTNYTDPTGKEVSSCLLSVLGAGISAAGLVGFTIGAVAAAPTGVGFVAAVAWWNVSAWGLALSVASAADSCG
jgi:RHS repeat-associated protein